MHGKGKLEYSDSERYEGDFYNGEANGTGYYAFESGDFYAGEFLDGKMNGEGSYFTRTVMSSIIVNFRVISVREFFMLESLCIKEFL